MLRQYVLDISILKESLPDCGRSFTVLGLACTGIRIGQVGMRDFRKIAALKLNDVRAADGSLLTECVLGAAQTKGGFLPRRSFLAGNDL